MNALAPARAWASANEIAKARIPGLPGGKRGVAKHLAALAENERPGQRPRKGAGGGIEFSILDLKLNEVQREAWYAYCLAELELPAAPVDHAMCASASTPLAPVGAMPASQIDGAAGAIVAATLDPSEVRPRSKWDTFERTSERGKARARFRFSIVQFAAELRASKLHTKQEACAIAAKKFGISVSSVRNWLRWVDRARPDDWLPELLDRHAGNPSSASYPSRIDDIFRAFYLRLERPSAARSYEHTRAIAAGEGLDVPSLPTILRRMRRDLTPQAIVAARHGRRALEDTFPAQERDRSVFHAGQAYGSDGMVFAIWVIWPDGTRSRACMVHWIDLYSGAPLAWRVASTENLDLVRLSFGDAIEHGLPDEVYLDNGMGFAAHWLSGRIKHRFRFKLMPDEPAGVFELCGIRVHWALPRHGQSKPIERLHREIRDRVDKHPKLARAASREHAVPLQLFLSVLDEQMRAIRTAPGRRAKNCSGRSFWATFEEGLAKVARRMPTEQQKRLFLLAVQNVQVSDRDGTFRLTGENRYGDELGASPVVALLGGQKVTVRFDPQRLREPVHVYRLTGEYVGAAHCVLPVGFNDTQAAREHARLKRQNVKYHLGILENERRMKLGEVTALLPDPPPAPELVDSKVVRLFRPQIEQPTELRPANDLASRRRAEYERLSAIPRAELTIEQVRFIKVYEAFGDDLDLGIGRSA